MSSVDERDIGKLCWFWNHEDEEEDARYGELDDIQKYHRHFEYCSKESVYCTYNNDWEFNFKYCKLMTKQEIAEKISKIQDNAKKEIAYLKQFMEK